jgi:hypothetical protein
VDILIMLIIVALPFVGVPLALVGAVTAYYGWRHAAKLLNTGIALSVLGALGWLFEGPISQLLFPSGHL